MKCEICGQEEVAKGNNGKVKELAIDHCHKTGVVRGRLCMRCNTTLGRFNDDIEFLEKAIAYLKTDWVAEHEKRVKKVASLLDLPYGGTE